MSAPDFSWTAAAPVRAVMAALGARGEARFVGGCVRDSLLGRPPAALAGKREAGTTDIDVATTLLPEETMAALQAAGLAAHPTGMEHGTVTAVAQGLPVEVTTLRADMVTDGRHAQVRFTTDWEEDWRRRDFTINAMYSDAHGEIWDPAGGRGDLAARKVRFIGDPAARIDEDYLRILRFFRFTARYADAPHTDGLAACAEGAEGLRRLSKERIWQEVAKLFSTPKAPMALSAAAQADILRHVVSAPVRCDEFRALHGLLSGAVAPAIGLEILWPSVPAGDFKAAFKPATAVLDRIAAMREAYPRLAADDGAPLRRALYLFGTEAVRDAALLHAARVHDASADYMRLYSKAEEIEPPRFPVKGKDLVARGMAPGPALGETLAAIEAEWLAAGCPEGKTALEPIIAAALGH